jgi:hypothetical protein
MSRRASQIPPLNTCVRSAFDISPPVVVVGAGELRPVAAPAVRDEGVEAPVPEREGTLWDRAS